MALSSPGIGSGLDVNSVVSRRMRIGNRPVTAASAIDARHEALDRRLAGIETRYRDQFVALDTLLGNLSAAGNFLTQQLQQLQRSDG